MAIERTRRIAANLKSWLLSLPLCWLAACGAANAASQQDWDACAGKGTAQSVPACSRILADQSETGQNRADAYLFRAGAYLSQGNFDSAIADYSEAIKLAPRNVVAYAGRAVAYLQKGDRYRAMIDYTLASQLDAKALANLAATNGLIGKLAELERSSPPASLPPSPAAPAPSRQGAGVPATSFAGTYEGAVERRLLTGAPDEPRTYRLTINPDNQNGTVWIYRDGNLLYVLLFSGTLQGNTFVGKTRPVQATSGGYTPDNIQLEFAPDAQSVLWYHNDGTKEGSGTLKRM